VRDSASAHELQAAVVWSTKETDMRVGVCAKLLLIALGIFATDADLLNPDVAGTRKRSLQQKVRPAKFDDICDMYVV
jgi:hypothetical protein